MKAVFWMIMFLDVKLGERVDYVNQLGFNSVIFFCYIKLLIYLWPVIFPVVFLNLCVT